MKILIDLSFIRYYELTKSIPLYGLRLLQAIPESRYNDVHILINGDLEYFFQKQFPQFKTTSVKIAKIWRKTNWRIQNCVFDLKYKKIISNFECDIILTLNELTSRTTFATRKLKISVIHDLKDLSLTTGKNFIKSKCFYSKLIDNADIVVAISEYTRQNILQHYDVDTKKIKVIHNSVKISNVSKRPPKLPNGISYILYVNTLLEYKNPLTILKAFNAIKEKTAEHLILVGKDTLYWDEILLPYIRNNGLANRVIRMQNLKDEELRFLYEHASVFVSCSQHEGFGYTPIEAAICCCPVICTKCEAIPETTMMLLNYYEPAEDDKELAKCIKSVLEKPRDFQTLKAISDIFRREYSPEKQVKLFFSLMEDLMQQS